MKLRIIKEEGVFRIQEECEFIFWTFWKYAKKATYHKVDYSISFPIDFKSAMLAEKFIEHNYVIKVIKEYEVEEK